MRLEKIVEAVVATSRRPDLQDDAIRAVRAVITQVHTGANFSRDLIEDMIEVEPAFHVKLTLPKLFRKMKAIVPLSKSGAPMCLTVGDGTLERIDSAELFTPGGSMLQNCYYIAGSSAVVRCQVATPKFYISYWAAPDISDPYLETWAMAANPELFIIGALAKVLTRSRQEQQGAIHQREFDLAYAQLITDNVGV